MKNGAGFVYFITNISDRKEKFQQTFKVASKYLSDIQWRTKNSIVDLQESLILMIVTIEGEQKGTLRTKYLVASSLTVKLTKYWT